MRRDTDTVARSQKLRFPIECELHRAARDEGDLLVWMVVLRHHREMAAALGRLPAEGYAAIHIVRDEAMERA